MNNFSSIASSAPGKLRSRDGFTVKAQRVHPGQHHDPGAGKPLYFYVRLYLAPTEAGPDRLTLADIEMVTYKLDPSFSERLRVSQNRETSFEIKIWTYGFFEVDATLLTTWGQQIELRGVRLEWDVSQAEAERNGDEVAW